MKQPRLIQYLFFKTKINDQSKTEYGKVCGNSAASLSIKVKRDGVSILISLEQSYFLMGISKIEIIELSIYLKIF